MPEARGSQPSHFLKHALSALAGAGAFLLAAWGIAAALPFPDVPALAPKYRYLQEHRAAYDILFVGSSRFYHQIIPKEFDEAVERLTGQRVRSFNAGYDAVWPPESLFFLRELLALKQPRLKWVLIDSMNINPKLDDPERITRRQAYWHDWQHTRMAVAAVWESARTRVEKRALVFRHLAIWLRQCVSLGRGAEAIFARMEPVKTKVKVPEWDGAEGFHEGGTKGMEGEARENYLVTVDRLSQGLEPVTPGPALAQAFHDAVADVRAAGAEPVFVIPPTLNEEENLASIPGDAALIPLNDPQKYPGLFEPDLHYDGWHLNERGAHEFTRILAEHFVALGMGGAK